MAVELIHHDDRNVDLDDLLGAYELIGAARRGASMGRRGATPHGHGVPHGRGGSSVPRSSGSQSGNMGMVEKQPTKTRRHYIPVNSVGTIAAAAAASLSTQPQAIAFRPERIVVPASIAPDFTIDSVFCGIKPQFVATGSISAETFTQDARDVDMHMDTVNTSQNFTLNVTNQSGAPRQFRATVFGTVADD